MSESVAVLLAFAKVRDDADVRELERLWGEMYELVTSDAAFEFVRARRFAATDGSELAVYEFGSIEALERFRVQRDHVEVQGHGAEFFEWLENDVCILRRRDRWRP